MFVVNIPNLKVEIKLAVIMKLTHNGVVECGAFWSTMVGGLGGSLLL